LLSGTEERELIIMPEEMARLLARKKKKTRES
jgi:hypothetical protein